MTKLPVESDEVLADADRDAEDDANDRSEERGGLRTRKGRGEEGEHARRMWKCADVTEQTAEPRPSDDAMALWQGKRREREMRPPLPLSGTSFCGVQAISAHLGVSWIL